MTIILTIFYLLLALASYIFSFFGLFSIGLWTLSLTFIFLALAIGYSMKWIKHPRDFFLTIGLSLVLWYTSVTYIDDSWLFYPMMLITGS